MKVWTSFIWIRSGPVASCCENGNGPVGSIKDKVFLFQLSDYQLLKKDSAQWN